MVLEYLSCSFCKQNILHCLQNNMQLMFCFVTRLCWNFDILTFFLCIYVLQGSLHVASIYAGKESIQLQGTSIIAELKYLLNLLTLCWHFSKKPFPIFLEATGYSQEDVLFQEPKAGVSDDQLLLLGFGKFFSSLIFNAMNCHFLRRNVYVYLYLYMYVCLHVYTYVSIYF